MMGMFGVSEYDVPNVKSDDSIGFAIGTKVMNQFIVEGSIVFSKYFLEQTMTYNPFFEKIDQYNVGFAVKSPVFEGQIFKGRVLPIVGLIGSYTRRSYKEQSLNGFSQGRQDATTNDFDVGLVAGLDFNVTRNFAIGADYKYMFNLTGGGDSSYYTGRIDFERDDPLEELNYHQISLNGKFKF